MKHAWNLCLLACSIISSISSQTLVAQEQTIEVKRAGEAGEAFEIKPWQDVLTKDLESFMSGQKPTWALEWNEGLVLPVYIHVNGDFFVDIPNPDLDRQEHHSDQKGDSDQEQTPTFYVHTTSHAYVRNLGGKFWFSDDLNEWLSFEEFFTGEIHAGIMESRVCLNLTLRRSD